MLLSLPIPIFETWIYFLIQSETKIVFIYLLVFVAYNMHMNL
jgi:hypothetical protein